MAVLLPLDDRARKRSGGAAMKRRRFVFRSGLHDARDGNAPESSPVPIPQEKKVGPRDPVGAGRLSLERLGDGGLGG